MPTPESLSSRRDILKTAAVAGAGLALGALTAKAAAAPSAPANPVPIVPASGPNVTYNFKLAALRPQVDNAGGSVTLCRKENFPVVGGNAAAIYLLRLAPGGLREPHWHPNAWEFDYVVAGKVRMTIVPPDGVTAVFELEPGDVAFVPQGYTHSIKNIGDVEAVIPIVFNNEMPSDIGISTMRGGFNEGEFAQSLGVPVAVMAGFPKFPPGTSYIAP